MGRTASKRGGGEWRQRRGVVARGQNLGSFPVVFKNNLLQQPSTYFNSTLVSRRLMQDILSAVTPGKMRASRCV